MAAASASAHERFPPFRSILFVPGDRPERYAKALASGSDAVCIDLEDAVAPGRKADARASAARFLATRPRPSPAADEPPVSRPGIVVRVNDPGSEEGRLDAAALATCPPPDAFMIPKVAAAHGIRGAQRLLGEDMPLLPIVETAAGLEYALQIGAAAPAVAALVFGGFDLSAELGAEPGWEPLLYARSRVVHAAALAGIPAIDMPSRAFRDLSGLRTEAERARRLGFTGKVVIHPAQIPVIHDVFAPSPEEVERARRIVEADRAAGGGVVAVDGKMVDRPVVAAARRVLARGRARP